MEVIAVGKALSSETRIRILRLLSERARLSSETFERYGEEYDDEKRRETIYRELENLVETGLLAKEYNETAGRIEYRLRNRRLLFDLESSTVEPYEDG